MSAVNDDTAAIERSDAGSSAVFRRPAELVDITEYFYRRVFAVGLWVAVGCTAFAVLSSLLQPAASQLSGVIVSSACLAAVVLAARRPAVLYCGLRSNPWMLLVASFALGTGALVVGSNNSQFFLLIVAIVGVFGIATPLRVVAAAGLVTAAGLAAPQLLGGRSNIAGAVVVIVPPLMFWLIVECIASFTLRLHQNLGVAATVAPSAPETSGRPDPSARTARRRERSRRALPIPAVMMVGGIRLTSRQLQVTMLACEGLEHAAIGACLDISPRQVGRHLRNAEKRTGSASTPQLVAWAYHSGLAPRARPRTDGRS